MLRIAICDDDRDQLGLIKMAIETYCGINGESAVYTLYDKAFDFIDDIERHRPFDIVFLDICLPGMLGTDIAEQMRQEKMACEIIFLTSSDEFAVDAFAVDAAHYILKPFTQEQINTAMDRALERIRLRGSRRMILHIAGGIRVVQIDDIQYIASNGHILTLYLKDGSTVEVRQTMTAMLADLESLAPRQFVSPIKGYIVNQREICYIKTTHLKVGDKEIPLTKGGYKPFKDRYFDYLFSL